MNTELDQDSCKRVVVLGASPKPERYANKAILMLKEKGHEVIPIHPKFDQIEGLQVIPRLSEIKEPYDTLTLYVGLQRSETMIDEIIASAPKRVIMNPGSESELLETRLKEAGIWVVHGCTLVMLQTGQF